MASPAYSPSAAFAEHERAYFVPLLEKLGVRETARHISLPNWAAVDAACGSLIVRLEYERGLIAFCVASTVEPGRFWPIEFVAELFPRIRLMSAGFQRLSIDEQSTFLLQHIQEIQRLFASEHYPATRERLQRVHT